MRKMDAMAASAGLIACLIFARPDAGESQDMAADAWMVERGVEVALNDLSISYEACYAASLRPASDTDSRSRMLLASTCSGDPTSSLT